MYVLLLYVGWLARSNPIKIHLYVLAVCCTICTPLAQWCYHQHAYNAPLNPQHKYHNFERLKSILNIINLNIINWRIKSLKQCSSYEICSAPLLQSYCPLFDTYDILMNKIGKTMLLLCNVATVFEVKEWSMHISLIWSRYLRLLVQ